MIEKAIQISHKLLELLKTGALVEVWLHIYSLYIVSEIFKATFYRCLDSWKADVLWTQQWQVAAGLRQGVCFLLRKMGRNKLWSLKKVMHVEIFGEFGLVTSNTMHTVVIATVTCYVEALRATFYFLWKCQWMGSALGHGPHHWLTDFPSPTSTHSF